MGLSLTLPSPAKRAPLSSSGKMRAPGQLELRARCAHGSDGEATQQPWPDESPVRSSGWTTPNSEGFIRSESIAATAAALQPSYDYLSFRTSPVCSFNSSHSWDVSSTSRSDALQPSGTSTRTKPKARALEAAAAHTCCLRSSVVTRTNWMMSSCACIKPDALVYPIVPKNSR
jgi:hypothetical protein